MNGLTDRKREGLSHILLPQQKTPVNRSQKLKHFYLPITKITKHKYVMSTMEGEPLKAQWLPLLRQNTTIYSNIEVGYPVLLAYWRGKNFCTPTTRCHWILLHHAAPLAVLYFSAIYFLYETKSIWFILRKLHKSIGC